MNFQEFGLSEAILSGIVDMGFTEPTPIQERAIPHLVNESGDLIALASTGTGKTAAFGLPLLNQLEPDVKTVQGLIVCPTRELCVQISNDLTQFSRHIKKLSIVAVYGGTDIVRQMKQIERGSQIIVATPGRLVDLIKRKKVQLDRIETVVLDEADEMLNMGFKEDLDRILEQTPQDKSVWLFSATMPSEVAQIAKNYMQDPFEITVGVKNEGNKNIEHHAYTVKDRDRYPALKRLLDYHPTIYGLVFCRTRRETAAVADKLMADGYNAEPLHGDLSQAQRDRVMQKFRDKTLQVLVATDVAARGIDVHNITHVIHYNLPEEVENYTHRSGRTARAGKKGTSIVIAGPREGRRLRSIEHIIHTSFISKKLPTPHQICERQLLFFVDKMSKLDVDKAAIAPYLAAAIETFQELSKEELIERFIYAEFNQFLTYYAQSKTLDAAPSSSRESTKDKRRTNRDWNKNRFFVDLGRKDGLNQGALLRMICDYTGVPKGAVGKIDVLKNFAFFEADKPQTDRILSQMQHVRFEGQSFGVELTTSKGEGQRYGKSGVRGKYESRNRKRRRH